VQASMVDTGLLDWTDVARVLSEAPARIGRLVDAGAPLAAGSRADITLYDPAVSRDFGLADLAGRSVNTPYLGRRLPGRVVATLHRGVPTVLDGQLRPHDEVVASVRAVSARG
jgi:dihydroorotase